MATHHRTAVVGVVAISLGLLASPAAAIEKLIKIDQNKAVAGGVTPGDGPGFPVTLTQPGKYVLTSNLYATASVDGIEVKNFDITIDFDGFRLHGFGQNGNPPSRNGVFGLFNTATIRNGVIAGFKQAGIGAVDHEFWTVENMRLLVNGADGVNLGDSGRVLRSTIADNGKTGVSCSVGCLIEGNIVNNNTLFGIEVSVGTVLGNTIFGNGGRQGIV